MCVVYCCSLLVVVRVLLALDVYCFALLFGVDVGVLLVGVVVACGVVVRLCSFLSGGC